jgi:hypothetical protein
LQPIVLKYIGFPQSCLCDYEAHFLTPGKPKTSYVLWFMHAFHAEINGKPYPVSIPSIELAVFHSPSAF